ncbi:hypothetical protein HKX48_006221 [Thoreauomyces humboldtii]|nr:hypothetical protein HKX48_006221 [Thoreauomyces humboldtii]
MKTGHSSFQPPKAWLFDYELDFDVVARGLAQVLQRHQVYAGRLVDVTDNVYQIELSNEGVPLAKGTSSLTLDELAPAFVAGGTEVKHPAFAEFLHDPHQSPVSEVVSRRKPLITASLITLADKSSAIAVRFPHSLFDTAAIGMFMRDWADAVRGKFDVHDDAATNDTVKCFNALADPANHIPFEGDITGPNPTALAFPSAEALGAMIGKMGELLPQCAYVECHLPADRLEDLVASLRKDDPRLSQNDCISALIVKSAAECRSPGAMRVVFSADLRLRVSPASPEARASAQMPLNLPPLDASSATLSSIASAFRDVVLDKDAVGRTLGVIYGGFERGLGARICPAINLFGTGPGSTADFFVSQWTRSGFYAMDFGKGTPRKFVVIADAGPAEPGSPNFAATWPAPPGVGGVVVGISLYTSELELFRGKMAEFAGGKHSVR